MPDFERLPEAVAAVTPPGDLVITLGAGSIGAVGDRILEELRSGTKGGDDSNLAPRSASRQPAGNHREGEGA